MNENTENAYIRGQRSVWLSLLQKCIAELGYSEATKHAWMVEREQAIAALRSTCEEFGDNDWPDNLHLADIIEKHINWNGLT